jgi:transcriptional regulator with XRE-family HTH domain
MNSQFNSALFIDFGKMLLMTRTFVLAPPKSQQEIAQLSGLDVTEIRDFELGRALPCDAQICRLANALRIDTAFLLRKARQARQENARTEKAMALATGAGHM